MVQFLGLPNFEYIGGGIVILIAVVWFLIKRSEGGRTGIQRENIRYDNQLISLDKKILRTGKDEIYEAKTLYKLFLKVHKRANKLGLAVNDRVGYLNAIITRLNILKSGKIENTTEDKKIVGEINDYINLYLNNFPLQDKQILELVSEIRTIQGRLYGDIKEQIDELEQKKGLLRKEEEQTELEEAA